MKITPNSRTSVTLPTSTRETGHWSDSAACLGMPLAIFFPDALDMAANEYAKRICRRCPVIDKCRDDNLSQRYGVFGGLSEIERDRYRRRRRGLAS